MLAKLQFVFNITQDCFNFRLMYIRLQVDVEGSIINVNANPHVPIR